MDDYLAQCIAALMHEELLCSRLDVSLAPSGPEHQPTRRRRRIVEERNPAWYRRLCRDYQSHGRQRPRRKKHGGTLIKRSHVLRALEELANGRCETEYAHRLRPYVEQQTTRFLQEHHGRTNVQAQRLVGSQADKHPSGRYPARPGNIPSTAA